MRTRAARLVHDWFELSYAQYLTVPRSALQSMPEPWQERLVALLDELDDSVDWRPEAGSYWVTLRDGAGRFVSIERDPLMDYDRGRRVVGHRPSKEKMP